MKQGSPSGEIALKRRVAIVRPSTNQPWSSPMITTIKNALRRADERARHRREYEMLLQGGDDIFRDIGTTRQEVAFRRKNMPIF